MSHIHEWITIKEGLQNKQAAHPESCAKAFRMQARGEVKEYSLLAHTKKKKIIYLIRHAQALHNVEEKKEMDRVRKAGGTAEEQDKARKEVLFNPAFKDATLTGAGENQVHSKASDFRLLLQDTHYPPPTTVFCSPLNRALQTASLLFSSHGKIVAKELLREKRTGKHCDEREPASVQMTRFPQIDVSDIVRVDATTTDGIKFRKELQEGNPEVQKRAAQIVEFIKVYPEDVLAIVTHKGVLREMAKGPLAPFLNNGDEHLEPVFNNVEIRVMEMSFNANGDIKGIRQTELGVARVRPFVELSGNMLDFAPHVHSRRIPSTAGGIRAAAGISHKKNDRKATAAAWGDLKAQLGDSQAQLVIVFCKADVQGKAVMEALKPLVGPKATVIGGTTANAVLSEDGLGRIGVLAFSGLGAGVGVGVSTGACEIDTAEKAGSSAMQQAMKASSFVERGLAAKDLDLMLVFSAPGFEDFVFKGISEQLATPVPVFGGSFADDSASKDIAPGKWWQLVGSDQQGWKVFKDAVIVVPLVLFSNVSFSCGLSHCYDPTFPLQGIVTKASRRTVEQIDHRSAAYVLNEWTGGKLKAKLQGGLVLRESALNPLALQQGGKTRLIHPKEIKRGGVVECFGDVKQGDVIKCLNSKPSDLIGRAVALARAARDSTTFDVEMAVIIFCAGTASAMKDLDEFQEHLAKVLPKFFCFFTFGEIGLFEGSPVHCNLMCNILLFGTSKKFTQIKATL